MVLPSRVAVCLGLFVLPAVAYGQAPPARRPRSRRMPVQLWPPSSGRDLAHLADTSFEIDGWHYDVRKSPDPRGGVPWNILVTPIGENVSQWRSGDPFGGSRRSKTAVLDSPPTQDPNSVPSVAMPDILWKQRMSANLRGNERERVVGVHFHDLVTDDRAGILFTLHKVPPDEPDGHPPKNYKGKFGSRVEATLLAPVAFSLDQAIAVREDPLKTEQTAGRIEHEFGHAGVSQQLLLAAMAGPQTWNVPAATGQRSHIAYYWKRQHIGRTWKGYDHERGKLATLRTTIVLVPPTRWSILLPVPPERVTQRQLQDFNDSIVMTGARFEQLDRAAQQRFHAQHGAYQRLTGP